eukprot:5157209-Prymnesium_polylepis.1
MRIAGAGSPRFSAAPDHLRSGTIHCREDNAARSAVAFLAAVLLSTNSPVPTIGAPVRFSVSDSVELAIPWDSVDLPGQPALENTVTGATAHVTRLVAVTAADVKESPADAKVMAAKKG